MIQFRKLSFLVFYLNLNFFSYSEFGVSLIGYLDKRDGLGQIALGFIDSLKNNFKINLIKSGRSSIEDLNSVNKVVEKNDFEFKKICIFTNTLFNFNLKLNPDNLNVAYSMFESSKIPELWVNDLNNNFDLVLVPDNFYVGVYKNSGVKIPVFELPMILNLDSFLNRPLKKFRNSTFVFGVSAAFWGRHKNIDLLVESFSMKFGNDSRFKLKIHGRKSLDSLANELYNKIQKLNLSNVEFIYKNLTDNEYLEFFESLDCYILLSKGEGFSITPRQAMALGIPCILSSNTSHVTICETNLVLPVKSNILEAAYYEIYAKYFGNFYNCEIHQVVETMEKLAANYDKFLEKSSKMRDWVKNYSSDNLKNKYLSIIKPSKIILGNENLIFEDYIVTDSENLLNKYKLIWQS